MQQHFNNEKADIDHSSLEKPEIDDTMNMMVIAKIKVSSTFILFKIVS